MSLIHCLRMTLAAGHARQMPRPQFSIGALVLLASGLAACAGPPHAALLPQPMAQPAVAMPPPAVDPSPAPSFTQNGLASWYGRDFHRKHTASGEGFDMNGFTAAHRSLPLDTIVRVTNLDNGQWALVRVNDRGPFAHGRVIDVSRSAAVQLGMIKAGIVPVRLEVFDDDQTKSTAASARLY
jgi:rare lipoprotein A (peptidoglycan hydrolase)